MASNLTAKTSGISASPFCTKLAFSSVYHPQSNDVVERANDKIFTAIKKMLLDDKKSKWADLLPEAVWALNTTE
jgi:hypothetical protein